ncbi:bem46 protein, variant [Aspergillus fumigatus]
MSESPPPPPSWSIAAMANNASLVWLETDRVSSELIYPRNVPADARTNVPSPRQFGISDYEDLQIPTPDGESLHAFFIRPANKQHARNITVLMFHGNAGNIGHRVPIAKVLQEILGCNVLMLEYRGYGLSTGVPDEAGLKIDAQTGFDYLRQRAETRNTTIIVYGQSLGGAVAINLVAENQDSGDVGGLILENTFLSIRKLIPTVFPPARYLARLCHQHWASEEVMPKIRDVPILFLSGLKDELVPSNCKVWRTLPNGGHNDTVAESGYFEHIYDFVIEEVIRKH